MKRDHVTELKKALIGRRCWITRDLPTWWVNFDDGSRIAFRWPWRLVADGRVVFGDQDDGHWFGLSEPVDGEKRCASFLKDKIVSAVEIDKGTGDLRILLGRDIRIDAFHFSGGYEGWDASYTVNGERWSIVAMGGGEMAVVPG